MKIFAPALSVVTACVLVSACSSTADSGRDPASVSIKRAKRAGGGDIRASLFVLAGERAQALVVAGDVVSDQVYGQALDNTKITLINDAFVPDHGTDTLVRAPQLAIVSAKESRLKNFDVFELFNELGHVSLDSDKTMKIDLRENYSVYLDRLLDHPDFKNYLRRFNLRFDSVTLSSLRAACAAQLYIAAVGYTSETSQLAVVNVMGSGSTFDADDDMHMPPARRQEE